MLKQAYDFGVITALADRGIIKRAGLVNFMLEHPHLTQTVGGSLIGGGIGGISGGKEGLMRGALIGAGIGAGGSLGRSAGEYLGGLGKGSLNRMLWGSALGSIGGIGLGAYAGRQLGKAVTS